MSIAARFAIVCLLGACGGASTTPTAATATAHASSSASHAPEPGPWDGDAGPPRLLANTDASVVDDSPRVSVNRCDGCTQLNVVFVLDHAQSLGGAPLDAAKAGIIAAVARLGSDDGVGVVTVDTQPTWVVPFRRASDRDAVAAGLRRVQAGNTKNYVAALLAAFDQLRRAPSRSRHSHIVVVGNGISGTLDARQIAQTIAAEGITISSVAIGYAPDVPFLRGIADASGGTFRDASDPTNVQALIRRDVEEELAR